MSPLRPIYPPYHQIHRLRATCATLFMQIECELDDSSLQPMRASTVSLEPRSPRLDDTETIPQRSSWQFGWRNTSLILCASIVGGVSGFVLAVGACVLLAGILILLQVGLNTAVVLSFLPIALGPAGSLFGLMLGWVWAFRYLNRGHETTRRAR